jgi:hypothetical protein
MPEVKRSRPKRNQKRGPKKERLIIDIDPEEAMKTLLRKASKGMRLSQVSRRFIGDGREQICVRSLPA